MLQGLNTLIHLEKLKTIHNNGEEAILYEVRRDSNHLALNTTDVPDKVKQNAEHVMREQPS